MIEPTAGKPLAGTRVIDFTVSVAGPLACSLFADLGAEVIKVEEPDGRRGVGADMPLRPGAPDRPYNRNSTFNERNRGKLSATIDVSRPQGRDLFLRLVRVADIVIENFSPHVVGNLGLAYEDGRSARPDIIYLSISAFGRTGPYADLRSYGPGVDAMSGLSHLTGYAGGQPLKPGNFFCDQNTALLTVFAALAALRHRHASGNGQFVEVPMLEGEIHMFGEALMDVALNGRDQARIGNGHPSIAPHGVYPCKGDDGGDDDEWVTIVAADDRQWGALCRAMERDDLLRDSRFAASLSRWRNQEALDQIIAGWTADKDKYAVQEALQARGVSAMAALSAGELFTDPHLAARGLFEFVDHPESVPLPHTRAAFTLSESPTGVTRSAPLLGGDNEYILRDLLAIDDETVARLLDQGIIGTS